MAKSKEKQRVLTNAEKKRIETVQQITAELEDKGYQKEEVTINLVYANVMAFVLCLPICAAFAIWFSIYNSGYSFHIGMYQPLIFLLLILVFVIVHELIHGICWSISAKNHWKSIDFGFIKEYLTPYCTCMEPLTKPAYIIGCLMPGIVLGILPMTVAVFMNSISVLLFGAFMTLSAGGDLLIALKLLLYKYNQQNAILLDHPTLCGFIIYKK